MLSCLFLVFNDLLCYSVVEALTFEYNYGFLLGMVFVCQTLSGLLLSCFYLADNLLSYDVVFFIGRNIVGGWLLSFIHVDGASLIFLLFYLHMFNGLCYLGFSFSSEIVWLSGFMIFLLTFLIGFSGYSLVWGQMSYWALTVITNLVTALPLVGYDLLEFIWSNVVISSWTLRSFYTLHFLFPFICLGLVCIHIVVIHRMVTNIFVEVGVLGVDNVFFGLYFINDLLLFIVLGCCALVMSCSCYVNLLVHSDNFMSVMPFVTPAFIEPEWYFLSYYCVLSSIPHNLIGTICFAYSVVLFGLVLLSNDYSLGNVEASMLVYWILLLVCMLGLLSLFPLVYPFSVFSLWCSLTFIFVLLSYC